MPIEEQPYRIDLGDGTEYTKIVRGKCGKQCSLFRRKQMERHGGAPTPKTTIYEVTCPQCGALKPGLISVGE